MASRSARAARADRRRSQPARAQGGRPETRGSFLRRDAGRLVQRSSSPSIGLCPKPSHLLADTFAFFALALCGRNKMGEPGIATR